jgi:hypothetical protein
MGVIGFEICAGKAKVAASLQRRKNAILAESAPVPVALPATPAIRQTSELATMISTVSAARSFAPSPRFVPLASRVSAQW